ncbi:unnamed protein product [Miscanthus lutarioriparius]|uniref:BHLH domain-containing protein n=1 Tax=Miscanthus lutarioriparius TaxID=422564 RepID=A0A811PVF8_9POAL|nr:unnamed protein product [Miscanthus lutarioriparius]
MDTLFVLGQESRLRILQQAAARVPGCAYLCAWAAIPAQPLHQASSSSSAAATSTSARLLCCLDAWLCDGGGDRPSLGDARRLRALFDAYRGSLCPPVAGCVPGWAYKDGRAYMELPAHDLTTSASLPVQQQFYQMAAFMGCESGEIEIGMSTAASGGGSPMSLDSTLQQVFSEDFFQQSLLEELLQLPPTRPSSPSSSLPSVSVGSPAADGSTSLQRTVVVTPAATTTAPSSVERQAAPPPHPRPPLPFVRHGGPGHVCFPSAEADDAVMAQAMLDVISASSSSALPTTAPSSATAPPPPPGNHHHRARRRGAATAFRAYNAALAPRAPWRPPGAPGQRMIKMGISILRRMHMLRLSRERTGGTTTMAQRGQEGEDDPSSPAVPSSSQLNHMISERRRRERLNESFEALRGLLPPGSKKDKATVLAKTLDYMNILVAQIADLKARNRSLESRAHHHHRHANGGSSSLEQRVVVLQGLMSGTLSSSERVQVHVTAGDVGGASTSSSSTGRRPPPSQDDVVTVRVHARAAQGDVAELVARALAVIKDMGCFTVVAVDAGRPSDGGGDVAQATFTLRATAGEFDAASLREAVRKAAEDSATPPSDDS